jgi:hypothetical protein
MLLNIGKHCCVAAQGLLGAATNIYVRTIGTVLQYIRYTYVKLQYRCQCNSVSRCAATAAAVLLLQA